MCLCSRYLRKRIQDRVNCFHTVGIVKHKMAGAKISAQDEARIRESQKVPVWLHGKFMAKAQFIKDSQGFNFGQWYLPCVPWNCLPSLPLCPLTCHLCHGVDNDRWLVDWQRESALGLDFTCWVLAKRFIKSFVNFSFSQRALFLLRLFSSSCLSASKTATIDFEAKKGESVGTHWGPPVHLRNHYTLLGHALAEKLRSQVFQKHWFLCPIVLASYEAQNLNSTGLKQNLQFCRAYLHDQ